MVGLGVIRADELRAAGHRLVALGAVIRPRLARIGVGPGADQEPLADEPLDAVEFLDRLVDLEPGGFGGRGALGGHEQQPILEGGVPLDVAVADRALVVQGEQDEAADGVELGPAPGADRLGQGRGRAADPVGRHDIRPVEHREDLGVDPVDLGAAELHGLGRQAEDPPVLELDHDQDRDVTRMGLRPGPDLLQGVDEGRGMGAEVDVLDVQDLQAGLAELTVGVRVGAGVLAPGLHHLPERRLGEETALGVGEHVELDLADAQVRELLGERAVAVVQALGLATRAGRDQFQDRRGRHDVVRVVGADDLDLVEPGLARPRRWRCRPRPRQHGHRHRRSSHPAEHRAPFHGPDSPVVPLADCPAPHRFIRIAAPGTGPRPARTLDTVHTRRLYCERNNETRGVAVAAINSCILPRPDRSTRRTTGRPLRPPRRSTTRASTWRPSGPSWPGCGPRWR